MIIINNCTCAFAHACWHTQTHLHTRIHTNKHAHTHTHTHIHTHVHTHTHIHTSIQASMAVHFTTCMWKQSQDRVSRPCGTAIGFLCWLVMSLWLHQICQLSQLKAGHFPQSAAQIRSTAHIVCFFHRTNDSAVFVVRHYQYKTLYMYVNIYSCICVYLYI